MLNHASSLKHKENSAPFGPKVSVQPQLSFNASESQDKIKKYEARTALYIATHSAVAPVGHLVSCMKASFPKNAEVQDAKLGRTKCSMIIKNIWGPYFKKELIDDIGDGFYSLLIDESTDISVTKYLGLVIIYYSRKQSKIESTYLTLESLDRFDAVGIAEAVKTVLIKFGLSISRMRGLGTDNASVMVGVNKGVFQLLKRENPALVLIPCVCHSLQLAVSEASKEQIPRVIEYLIKETYNWFANSSGRQAAYREIYQLINNGHNPLKIVRACKTRWLSIETAVSRIVAQFIELKLHFSVVRMQDNCYTAEMLFGFYSDLSVQAYLIFLKIILAEVQAVNKLFESNTTNHLKILDDLCYCISAMTKKICIVRGGVDPLTLNVESNLIPNPYLEYEYENFISQNRDFFTPEIEQNIKSRCVGF
jgi:Domain of unknown function (DUF4371)